MAEAKPMSRERPVTLNMLVPRMMALSSNCPSLPAMLRGDGQGEMGG